MEFYEPFEMIQNHRNYDEISEQLIFVPFENPKGSNKTQNSAI